MYLLLFLCSLSCRVNILTHTYIYPCQQNVHELVRLHFLKPIPASVFVLQHFPGDALQGCYTFVSKLLCQEVWTSLSSFFSLSLCCLSLAVRFSVLLSDFFLCVSIDPGFCGVWLLQGAQSVFGGACSVCSTCCALHTAMLSPPQGCIASFCEEALCHSSH